MLLTGEKSVGKIVEETGQGQANVSKHLKRLAESGLIARRKEGLQVFYRVDSPFVRRVCAVVCENIASEAAEQIARSRVLLDTLAPASTQQAILNS